MREGERHGAEGERLDLHTAYHRALEALAETRCELADAQKRSELAEERAHVLARLLALESPVQSDGSIVEQPPSLLDACERVIRENGGEMRLSELRETLLANRVPLPGKGTDANLYGRLERSGGRIVRVRRGVYGVPAARDVETEHR